MKERPIIFSKDMVKAILCSRKTQTRRVVKPQPRQHPELSNALIWKGNRFFSLLAMQKQCPYGQVGDRLWGREGFYSESGDIWYKADGQTAPMPIKWKPSIFMPRWASRITLEITGVRVERVQEITEEDAIAEGIIDTPHTMPGGKLTAYGEFMYLWNSINAKRGYGWDVNPWCWVISFKRLK